MVPANGPRRRAEPTSTTRAWGGRIEGAARSRFPAGENEPRPPIALDLTVDSTGTTPERAKQWRGWWGRNEDDIAGGKYVARAGVDGGGAAVAPGITFWCATWVPAHGAVLAGPHLNVDFEVRCVPAGGQVPKDFAAWPTKNAGHRRQRGTESTGSG